MDKTIKMQLANVVRDVPEHKINHFKALGFVEITQISDTTTAPIVFNVDTATKKQIIEKAKELGFQTIVDMTENAKADELKAAFKAAATIKE